MEPYLVYEKRKVRHLAITFLNQLYHCTHLVCFYYLT